MWFPPQYRKAGGNLVVIVVLFVLFLAMDRLFKWGLFDWLFKIVKEKKEDPCKERPEDGSLRAGFNPDNEARRIKELLDKWDLWGQGEPNIQAFDRLLSFNNAELKAVNNAWLRVHKGKSNASLRSQVDAEYANRDLTKQKKKQVLDRLDALIC